ncbi:MAG: FHA domain-containing protein [Oscillospiraceae bacterium]|nr:FHA domain-containing protein [Oscillospiraceae bacterium]
MIMYRDIKGARNSKKQVIKLGFEVLSPGVNNSLKEGSVIPITNGITIGRKPDNTLILSDEFVSGNHARISIIDDECYIEDLNSTNGTYVNNGRIKGKVLLEPSDEVKIGTVLFKLLG